VWVVDTLAPVTADTRPPSVLADPGRIEIAAPRNGFAAGQICVYASGGVRGLRVAPSDLVAEQSKISASQVLVRHEQFNYRLPALTEEPAAGVPLSPVWLTFRVPENSVPGQYTGSVQLDAEGLKSPVLWESATANTVASVQR